MAITHRSRVVLAAVALLLLVTEARAQDACTAEDGPVTCAACKAGADINTVSGLPRVTTSFSGVSSNLGWYTWFDCANGECQAAEVRAEMVGGDAKAPFSYVQSLVMYSGFFILATLFVCCCDFWMCCSRLCCCCCSAKCCGCGKWYPTYHKRGCCGWGFRKSLDPKTDVDKMLRYRACERFGVKACFFVFAVLCVIFILLGEFKGNIAMTDSMKSLAAAPDGVVSTTQKMTTPITDLIVNVAGGTLVGAIREFNHTIASAVSISVVADNIVCVADAAENLPFSVITSILDIINQAADALARMNAVAGEIENVLQTSDNATVEAGGYVDTLQTDLTNYEYAISNFSVNLAALRTDIDAIDGPLVQLKDPNTGAGSIANDLIEADKDSNYPTSTISDVTAGPNSLDELLSGTSTMVGVENSASRDTLVSNLGSLVTAFGNLPNLTTTAANIEAYSQLRTQLLTDGTLDSLESTLQTMQSDIDGLPNATNIAAVADALLATVNKIDTTQIREVVANVTDILNSLPQTGAITTLLDEVIEFMEVVPCIKNLVDQLGNLNTTVIQLPSMFADVVDMIEGVNDTVSSVRTQIDDASESINELQSLGDTFDLSALTDIADLVDYRRGNVSAKTTQLKSATGDVTSEVSSVNLTAAMNGVSNINTRLKSPSSVPNATLVNDLRDAGSAQTSLYFRLEDTKASIEDFAKGRCADNIAVICTADAQCGTTCEFAAKRCSNDGSACTGSGSECGGGYCLFEAVKYQTLDTILENFAKPSLSGASELSSQLNTVQGEINSFNLSATQDTLNVLESELKVADVPIATTLGDLNNMEITLVDTKSQLGSTRSSVDSLQSGLDAVPDVSALEDVVKSFNSSIASFQDQLSILSDVKTVVKAARQFLQEDLHGYLNRIDRPALEQARTRGGVEAVVTELVDVVTNITTWVAVQANTVDVGDFDFTADIRNAFNDAKPYLQILSNNRYFSHGAYYFALSMAQEKTVQPEEAAAGGDIFFNANGERWSDDRMCVTTKCVNNFIDFVNTESLATITSKMATVDEGIPDIPVPLSRVDLVGLPFLIPIIIVLLGSCAAFCCCPSQSKWQRWPACCACVFAGICMPLIFIVGAFSFPIVLAGGDACYGGFNIGYQYMEGSETSLCVDSFGGSMSDGVCNIALGDANVAVDITGLYSNLLGTCGGPDADPLASLVDALETAYINVPAEEVNKTLNDMTGDFAPRPPIKATAVQSAVNLGNDLSTFLQDVSGVLSCKEINGNVDKFHSAMCCEFMTAVYWSVSGWLLIGFSLCLCGCPALVLGYKRFPSQLWGKHYREEDSRIQQRIRNAAKRDVNTYPPRGGTQELVPAAGARFGGGGAGQPQQHVITVPPSTAGAGFPHGSTGTPNPMYPQQRVPYEPKGKMAIP